MKRDFLNKFLNRVSEFPNWVKRLIYNKLASEISCGEACSELFVLYRPILTYSGRCELDNKVCGYDENTYNMLEFANNGMSIAQISFNTYMSLQEVAGYFVFCVEQNYIEAPSDIKILNVAKFISEKYRTGEYFLNEGDITEAQLDFILKDYKLNDENKKFGQVLADSGLVNLGRIKSIIDFKEESKKRYVVDYNEVPKLNELYLKEDSVKRLTELESENKILKAKLEQLLTVVKENV